MASNKNFYVGFAIVSFVYDNTSVAPGEKIVMTKSAKRKLVDKEHKVELTKLID